MTAAQLITLGLTLAALTGILAAAVRDRRQPLRAREAETRPPRLLPLVRPMVRTLVAGRQPAGLQRILDWRKPPLPAPRNTGPVKHVGATEGFGDELHALADAPVSAELETEVEAIARYHAAFDAMMADFRFDLDHILDGTCARLDKDWRRVDADTTEWDVAGLRALLDAEDLVGAR